MSLRKIAGYSLMFLPFGAFLAAIIPLIPHEELVMIGSCFAIALAAVGCVAGGQKLIDGDGNE